MREAILAGEVATVLWLDRPGDRQLRAHAVFGDPLGLFTTSDDALTWYEPDSLRVREMRGAALIVAPYRSRDGELEFCLGRHPRALVEALLRLRRDNTPSASERKWRQFIGRLGAFPSVEGQRSVEAVEETVPYRGLSVRARRPVHPSTLIDRLMLRDRCVASDALERMLGAGAEEASARLSAR